ncbi:MAG: PD-(D/E)XK nuclease family protein [Minicystis sp.]
MTSADDPLKTLPSLSFSRYLRLKRCLLSGAALTQNGAWRGMRPPRVRAQVLGDIFHEVMAGINSLPSTSLSQGDFRTQFNAVVSQTHAKIASSPSSRHLGDPSHWPELVDLYRRLADVVEMRRTLEWGVGISTHAERKLTSRDGLLWGQVDAYFMSPEGIDLVDYKSGAILEDDEPKRDYGDQLYFYAYLIHDIYEYYPRSLSLVGRDGGTVQVPPSPARSLALANDVRATLARYNDLVSRARPLEELANPSSEACLFCDRKAICNKFWSAVPLLSIPQWNHVAIGMQATPLMRTPRGAGWLDLAVEKSSLATQMLKVTRLFEQRFPAIDLEHRVGQRLLFTGLRQANAANPAIVEATERTAIVCLGATS